jgi:hypothetical protein
MKDPHDHISGIVIAMAAGLILAIALVTLSTLIFT